MNMEDFVKINSLLERMETRTPGIKIINSKRKSSFPEIFKRDLEFYNSIGGNCDVSRVVVHTDCFVEIQLKDNSSPIVYYFTSCSGEVSPKIEFIRKICEDLKIHVDMIDY